MSINHQPTVKHEKLHGEKTAIAILREITTKGDESWEYGLHQADL